MRAIKELKDITPWVITRQFRYGRRKHRLGRIAPMPQPDTPDQPRGYSHFDPWQKQPRQCPHCHWQGAAGECTVGESYHNLTGMDCPRCAEELFVLTASTIEEVLAN